MSYRKLDKKINLQESLQKLEDLELKRFDEVRKIKEADFQAKKEADDELDTAFYFCVVFNTRNERDKWLKEHNIVLTEDFFVKSEDFIKQR